MRQDENWGLTMRGQVPLLYGNFFDDSLFPDSYTHENLNRIESRLEVKR
jgi:hypothetical protein